MLLTMASWPWVAVWAQTLAVEPTSSKDAHDELPADRAVGADELARLVERHRREIEEALRAVYRLTVEGPPREELLLSWLKHESDHFRWTAAKIIRERIPDGELPSKSLLTELRARMADPSPDVRRSALAIVGALNQPADAEAVMESLRTENDNRVREIQFRVLGQLQNPVAIPILLAEIADSQADLDCVIEATLSLGGLGAKARQETDLDLSCVVQPLRKRLAEARHDAPRLKRAILTTMAELADAAFGPDFVSALAVDHAEVLIPAIQGVVALGDVEQVDRLLKLLRHSDPQVRRAASIAIGTLGINEEAMAALRVNADPAHESDESVREAAWTAFRKGLQARSMDEQLEWIDLLSNRLDRQVECLFDLNSQLSESDEDDQNVLRLRTKLANSLILSRRFDEALPLLKMLFHGGPEHSRIDIAGDYLTACLHTGTTDDLASLIQVLTNGAPTAIRTELADNILTVLADLCRTQDPDRLTEIFTALGTVDHDLLGQDWADRLAGLWGITIPTSQPSVEVRRPR